MGVAFGIGLRIRSAHGKRGKSPSFLVSEEGVVGPESEPIRTVEVQLELGHFAFLF